MVKTRIKRLEQRRERRASLPPAITCIEVIDPETGNIGDTLNLPPLTPWRPVSHFDAVNYGETDTQAS